MLHIYVVHLSPNRLQILLNCLIRPTIVRGTGLCYHPHREHRRSKTGGRLRTSTVLAHVRSSAIFRSRFPSSQAGLWVLSWGPSSSFDAWWHLLHCISANSGHIHGILSFSTKNISSVTITPSATPSRRIWKEGRYFPWAQLFMCTNDCAHNWLMESAIGHMWA